MSARLGPSWRRRQWLSMVKTQCLLIVRPVVVSMAGSHTQSWGLIPASRPISA
jgi:hypothetical protein